MKPLNHLRAAALGYLFGFPECCITAFETDFCRVTKALYPDGPWLGTGFMPCACCAKDALDFDQFVAERITPNRLCTAAFPEIEDERVFALIAMFDEMSEPRLPLKTRLFNQVSKWSAQHLPAVHARVAPVMAFS